MKFKILLLIFFTGFFMKIESAPIINENQLKIINRKNGILSDLNIKPIEFRLPQIETVKLSDYETLYVYKDNTLPLIHLNLIIEGGKLQEKDEERGLYSLLVDLWKNGGANGKSGEEINEQLAELGIDLNFNLQQEFISVDMYCLKSNFKEAIKLIEEILIYPEFSENKLQSFKLKYIDAIKRRNDKPESIAARKIKEIMEYPSKIEESINEDDINKISREQIIQAYKNVLKHRRLHIAIDGDINEIDYLNIFKNLTKKLGAIEQPFLVSQQTINSSGKKDLVNKIVLVKKDIPQAVIVMGKYIPSYKSKDIFPLSVANYILGGGSFVSKMMREIRVKRGLAYYAYSATRFSAHNGKFISSSGTNYEQAQETLSIMLQLIKNFKDTIQDDDITIAKDALINSHIFEFSNPAKILYLYTIEQIYQPSISYIENYTKLIEQVSKDDVINTYTKHIKGDNLWIVIVGPEQLLKSLNKTGLPIVVIEPETKIDSIF